MLFILFKIFFISSPFEFTHISKVKSFLSGSNIPITPCSNLSISSSLIVKVIFSISFDLIGLFILIFFSLLFSIELVLSLSFFFHISSADIKAAGIVIRKIRKKINFIILLNCNELIIAKFLLNKFIRGRFFYFIN